MMRATLLKGQFVFSSLFFSTLLMLWSDFAAATTGDEAKRLLERMTVALQELSYQGVFVYRRDEDLSAMKVTHLAHQQGEHELLVTLTGEEREVSRDSQRLGLLSDGSSATGDQLATKRLAGIESHYQLDMLGMDRAAGRQVHLISVIPKDQYRYGYRLWIDEKTGLLLKSDLLGVQGKVIEQVMFTSLELLKNQDLQKPIAPKTETPEPGAVIAESLDAGNKMKWDIANLPAGFQLAGAPDVGQAEHLIYTDGLASVSVFIESASGDDAFVGMSNMGAVNAFGHLQDGYQVTVVGEVPEATVKMIGESIRYLGQPHD